LYCPSFTIRKPLGSPGIYRDWFHDSIWLPWQKGIHALPEYKRRLDELDMMCSELSGWESPEVIDIQSGNKKGDASRNYVRCHAFKHDGDGMMPPGMTLAADGGRTAEKKVDRLCEVLSGLLAKLSKQGTVDSFSVEYYCPDINV